ncbi:MAG: DeoR/GlpR transcriptional regulator [Thermomicrobiales bacterium]|nr:DeoR/GlpR transcriptional regulator [Thermomicrobiales bacterium]
MPAERAEQVRSFIERRQRATVGEIVTEFGISAATARRMLGALADRGEIRRVHGGALAVRHSGPEPPVVQRMAEQAEIKARIGRAAAALIEDGETIFISSGTTALEVARNLRERPRLTVITNSLLVADLVRDAPGIELIVPGGLLRRSEQSLIGHMTERALQELRAAKIVLGIRAIHPQHGLTNDYLPETQTDRAVLGLGGDVIVVADHTKCGVVSTAFVGPISAMRVLVTDERAPADFVADIETEGVRVVLA